MLHTQNWARARQRYADFWAHTLRGRALLQLSCPLEDAPDCPASAPLPVESLHDQWENIPLRHHNFLWSVYHRQYLAEGYPSCFINLGPGFLAACAGGSYKLAENTVWFENEQVVADYERDLDKVFLHRDGDAYRLVCDMTRYFAERADDRYHVSISDIGGSLDVVASLRGTQTLLTDLYDEPEGVLALTARVDEAWEQLYSELYALHQPYQSSTDTWQGLYCAGRYYALQCDFCAMISPDAFDRFVLPSLRRQCDFLDHALYHLDGPDELCHLDSLLAIPNLDAVQWVAGAGAAPDYDPCWFPMLRRIQDAGKNVVLLGVHGPDAHAALAELDQSRLFISAYCDDRRQAEQLLAFAERHA